MSRTPRILALFPFLVGLLAAEARADIPDDKTGRLREWQQRHLEFTPVGSDSYVVKMGTGTASVPVADGSLAERSSLPGLAEEVSARAFWRGAGELAWGVGVPIGAFLFYDNFLGNPRPLPGMSTPVVSYWPGNDLRSYALAGLGGAIAVWGAVNVGAWVSEAFGWSFPNLMAPDRAKEAVAKANEHLQDELVLTAADVASASETLAASGSATSSVGAATSLAGEKGSAAFYVTQAAETIRAQHGEGFRLYMVYSKDLTDRSGTVQRGSWHYCFYQPQRAESYEVSVPVFAGQPQVTGAPNAFQAYRQGGTLQQDWKIDSPKAVSELQKVLNERGIPWLPDEYALYLYPFYGNFQMPVWVLDPGGGQGIGTLPALDARSGQVINLAQSGLGALPGNAGPTGQGGRP